MKGNGLLYFKPRGLNKNTAGAYIIYVLRLNVYYNHPNLIGLCWENIYRFIDVNQGKILKLTVTNHVILIFFAYVMPSIYS